MWVVAALGPSLPLPPGCDRWIGIHVGKRTFACMSTCGASSRTGERVTRSIRHIVSKLEVPEPRCHALCERETTQSATGENGGERKKKQRSKRTRNLPDSDLKEMRFSRIFLFLFSSAYGVAHQVPVFPRCQRSSMWNEYQRVIFTSKLMLHVVSAKWVRWWGLSYARILQDTEEYKVWF
ncbi:hypothetical protein L210DRAFT_243651 [Boletus edulis BED1]|uniref:Uncharacterized protein n=1 Tax=Boletus edulis BED1 TaxID=1328754 RepID=A0AAD4BSR9_BOLED|nr:hypothetical protein L210DRAFT_243651 [Boletus edulis BED1]